MILVRRFLEEREVVVGERHSRPVPIDDEGRNPAMACLPHLNVYGRRGNRPIAAIEWLSNDIGG